MMLFENKEYYCQIVPSNEFVLSNPVIVGEQVDEDIYNGERWYWLKEDFESLGDAYDDIVGK
jgi:hypothetical protein